MNAKLSFISRAAYAHHVIQGYIEAVHEAGENDPIGYVGEILDLTYLRDDIIGADDARAEAAIIEATRIYSSVFGIAESVERVQKNRLAADERSSRFDDPTHVATILPFQAGSFDPGR